MTFRFRFQPAPTTPGTHEWANEVPIFNTLSSQHNTAWIPDGINWIYSREPYYGNFRPLTFTMLSGGRLKVGFNRYFWTSDLDSFDDSLQVIVVSMNAFDEIKVSRNGVMVNGALSSEGYYGTWPRTPDPGEDGYFIYDIDEAQFLVVAGGHHHGIDYWDGAASESEHAALGTLALDTVAEQPALLSADFNNSFSGLGMVRLYHPESYEFIEDA
jgi:hypothetical protein